MCRFASFWHNPINGDVVVYDLCSHSATREKLNINENLWREGHYLPNGEIECRLIDKDRITTDEANERMRSKFPTFKSFLGWALKESIGGSLDVSGCDLTGITLPTSIGGSLDVSGCDLTGITLPTSIGGSLYVRGCDLTGITLPTSIGGSLYVRGCDLTGITLPTSIGGSLDK
jgi:uncharacterized protein YjbI with pentapeptide repeats